MTLKTSTMSGFNVARSGVDGFYWATGACPSDILILAHLDDVGGLASDYCGNATALMNVTPGSGDSISGADPLFGAGSWSSVNGPSDDSFFSFGNVAFPTAAWCIECWHDAGPIAGAPVGSCVFSMQVIKADTLLSLSAAVYVDRFNQVADCELALRDEADVEIGIIGSPPVVITNYVIGDYNHVAVDYDGADYWFYVNGLAIGSISSATAIGAASDAGAAPYLPLQFSMSNGGEGHPVFIDEVRVSTVSRYPNGTPFVPSGPFSPP